jgi:hypothetical protein
MPTSIDIHEGFQGVTQEQFDQTHQADLDIQAEEGVRFERAWLDPNSGKVLPGHRALDRRGSTGARPGRAPGRRNLRGAPRGLMAPV